MPLCAVCSSVFRYEVLSRLFGAVLVFAGGLKIFDVVAPGELGSGLEPLPTYLIGILESLFGAWLLIGLWPSPSRIAALILLFALFNVALLQVTSSSPSCGCLGRVAITPWYALMFDSFMFLGLIAFDSTVELSCRFARIGRRTYAAIAIFLLSTTGVVLAAQNYRVGNLITRLTSPSTTKDMDVIRNSIRENDKYEMIEFRVDSTLRNAKIAKRQRLEHNSEGRRFVLILSPEFRISSRFLLDRNGAIRRDGISTGSETAPGEIVVRTGEKALVYHPERKQAWVQKDHEPGTDPLNPTCYGFEPPLRSIGEWIGESSVISIRFEGAAGEQVADIEFRDAKSRKVTVAFAERHSYLPIQVVYWNNDGSVKKSAFLNYQYLEIAGCWFLRKCVRNHFEIGATNDPAASNWGSSLTAEVLKTPVVNPTIRDDAFDPKLPAGTLVRTAGEVPNHRVKSESSIMNRVKPANAGLIVSPLALVIGNLLLLICGVVVKVSQFLANGDAK